MKSVLTMVGALLGVVLIGVAVYFVTTSGTTRQKRTMANIRAVATAAETHARNHKRYPASAAALGEVPRRDAWRHPLRYEVIELGDRSQVYFVASPGKDGRWQRPHLADYPRGGTTSFDADIVFSNGAYVQYPEGPQTQ